MNASEILELVRAGYTKAEIDQLFSGSGDPPEDPPADPPVDPPADPPVDPPADPPAEDQLGKRLDAIETRINHLINKANYESVKNSRQPDKPVETADDILSSLIRGKKKEE